MNSKRDTVRKQLPGFMAGALITASLTYFDVTGPLIAATLSFGLFWLVASILGVADLAKEKKSA